MTMFYLGGVGLSLFLPLLLFSKEKKIIADKILAVWLLLMTTHLLLFYLRKMGLYPQLLGMELPFPLVHGPFLYLYTLALTDRTPSLRTSVFHFIPFIAVVIYIIPFLALPTEQKIFVFKHNGAGYEVFNKIKLLAIIVSGVLYVMLSSIVLRKHRSSIADQFSYTEKINLQWLQYLVYGIGVIWVFVLFRNDDLIFDATVLFILFIGFFGIRQAGIFHSPSLASPNNTGDISSAATGFETGTMDELSDDPALTWVGKEKRKYQKSGLSADDSDRLHR